MRVDAIIVLFTQHAINSFVPIAKYSCLILTSSIHNFIKENEFILRQKLY